MGRVFTSESTGAVIHVFSDDHCPPHVHARHRGEDWIARVRFSFLAGPLELMCVVPLKNMPRLRTVNRFVSDIERDLAACRRSWWATRHTTCLAQQWATIDPSGRIRLASGSSANALQIAQSTYDPDEEMVHVVFTDGMAAEMSTRS